MPDSQEQPLLAILRLCAGAAPEPWYPSIHARERGMDRNSLDPFLERLRLAGLIQLTEWVSPEIGQGYRLTAEGERVLQRPRDLQQLEQGHLPQYLGPRDDATGAVSHCLTPLERGEIIRSALVEPAFPLVTLFLCLANVLVFLYGMVLAHGEQMLGHFVLNDRVRGVWEIYQRIGALDGLTFLQGEWWRLLTACFVHLGIIHLAVNMYTLYVIGPLVEQLWGRWRFLAIYLMAGLGGSCAMLMVEPVSGGAGASGALWGMMASFVAWVLLNRRHLPGPLIAHWLRSLLTVFLINVGISLMPGISAAAHFGGGLWGLATAALVNYQRFAYGWKKALATLGIFLLPVACVEVLAAQMQLDPRWALLEQATETRSARWFAGRVGPFLDESLEDALKLYHENLKKEVLDRHVERRDPAEVAKARATAARQQQRFEDIGKVLDRVAPFADPSLEESRQAARRVTAAARELFRLVDQCLVADEQNKQQEEALARQQAELDQQVQRWKRQWAALQRSLGE